MVVTSPLRVPLPINEVSGRPFADGLPRLQEQIALFVRRPGLAGVCLVLGVLSLQAATKAQRELHEQEPGRAPSTAPVSWLVTKWTAVVLLVSVGLFWAVGDWSAAVGQKRAIQVVAALPTWPSVTLYSAQDLNLSGPGVSESRCSGDESAFDYRYTGLKLVRQGNGQLFLLPSGWTPGSGPAIVLTKVDTIRQDFHPPGSPVPEGC